MGAAGGCGTAGGALRCPADSVAVAPGRRRARCDGVMNDALYYSIQTIIYTCAYDLVACSPQADQQVVGQL